MAETFYSVLGVDADADPETIKQAYRDRVKDHHPDVSDDDDAAETFKRITDARDVLLDESSRKQYDRVGHTAYVRRHLDSNAWSVDETVSSSSSRDSGNSRRRRSSRSDTSRTRSDADRSRSDRSRRSTDSSSSDPFGGDANGNAWAEEAADDWTASSSSNTSSTGGTSRNRRDPRQRARADGWETAHAASNRYRPTGNTSSSADSLSVDNYQHVLREVGPWLAFHFVFLISAFVTIWLIMSWAPSVKMVFLSLVLLGATIFFSILHLVSRVYS